MRDDVLLTRREVADLLQMREQTLATWKCNGRHGLPYVQVGRSIRYRPGDVQAWIDQHVVGDTAEAERLGPIVAKVLEQIGERRGRGNG